MEFSNDKQAPQHRAIRSFVKRAGRLTPGQQRALDELWPAYGLDYRKEFIRMDTIFGRSAQRVLEIGFGNGDNLAAMAANAPEQDFLGIEVHEPGVGHCMLELAKAGLSNAKVMRHDAVEVLRDMIPDSSISRVNLFFPDPWHKKRHNKRRIVQPEFVALLARKLVPEGMFHAVTDWPDYAEHISYVIENSVDFAALPAAPGDRVITRFDKRGERLGHQNWERAWRTCNKLPLSE